jgi:glucoamylase
MLSTSQQAPMGNRSTLVTIGKNGELRHLFWPTHNYPQHVRGSLPGLAGGKDGTESFSWLTDDPWKRRQRYLLDSTILETIFTDDRGGFEVKATDFVLPSRDTLVRVFEIANKNSVPIDTRFLYYNDFDIAETPIGDACYYDEKSDTIISYKRNYWFAFGSEKHSSAHQCGVHEEGSDAFVDSKDGRLGGNSLALSSGNRGVNSCLSWDLGSLNPSVKERLVLLMCFAHNKQDALSLIDIAKKSSLPEMVEDVNRYCQDWLKRAKIARVPEAWEDLLRRSLLTLRTLASPDFGGVVAAPTLEPDYRYVWSRDGTYVAYALDRCGYHNDAEAFYRWCKETQESNGGWNQRYHIERTAAPSWGEQEDQCATILWGIGRHYELTNNRDFLEEVWPTIKKGVDHLLLMRDQETGLVGPSLDLWEEKSALHTYTSSAASGALRKSAKLASLLGHDSLSVSWKNENSSLESAIVSHLWDEQNNRFLKSIKPLDKDVDTAIIGLSFPFSVLQPDDPRILSTAHQIENAFRYTAEGIGRYPGDAYHGGNPWFITTLWMALYNCQLGNYEKAKTLIDWSAKHVDEIQLFAEQVNKENGEPVSASPLAWSHAMFILSLLDFKEIQL